jgi:hypothetical protein
VGKFNKIELTQNNESEITEIKKMILEVAYFPVLE